VSWPVEWTDRALKDISRLPHDQQMRIINAVDRFAETNSGDVKKLQGEDDTWRLRVGDWRVRFAFVDPGHTILLLRILPRGRAY